MLPALAPWPWMAPLGTRVAHRVLGLTGVGRTPWAWHAQPDPCTYPVCCGLAAGILPLFPLPLVALWLLFSSDMLPTLEAES